MKPGSRKQRILRALQAAGAKGATTNELCGPEVGGERFGARLQELRDAGYVIDMAIIRQGQARYTLRGKTLEAQTDTPAVYHTVCDACGRRDQQYEWYARPCDCGAPGIHWVGVYHDELSARRHTPFRRVQVQQKRAA